MDRFKEIGESVQAIINRIEIDMEEYLLLEAENRALEELAAWTKEYILTPKCINIDGPWDPNDPAVVQQWEDEQ